MIYVAGISFNKSFNLNNFNLKNSITFIKTIIDVKATNPMNEKNVIDIV
jgi:hypothetical protein